MGTFHQKGTLYGITDGFGVDFGEENDAERGLLGNWVVQVDDDSNRKILIPTADLNMTTNKTLVDVPDEVFDEFAEAELFTKVGSFTMRLFLKDDFEPTIIAGSCVTLITVGIFLMLLSALLFYGMKWCTDQLDRCT